MPLTLIHAPQTPPVPSTTPSDAHDYQGSAQVQTSIINLQNGAGHAVLGGNVNDVLIVSAVGTIGSTASPTLTGPLLVGDGSVAAPTYSFSSQATTGIFKPANGQLAISLASAARFWFTASITTLNLASAYSIGWSSTGDATAGQDTNISRVSAKVIQVGNGDATGQINLAQVQTNTAAAFIATGTALTSTPGVNTATLTNAPTTGNPTKWIGINDNGTIRQIPAW